MADKHFHVHCNFNGQELRNFSLEKVAAAFSAPTDLYTGRTWFNSTTSRIQHYDGTAVKTVAHLEDIAKRNRPLGVSVLTGGVIPIAAATPDVDGSTTIEAGDYFIANATVALTPAPAFGSDKVEPGDTIIALVDNPATNGDWATVQTNLQLPQGMMVGEEVEVAAADFTGFAGAGTYDEATVTFPLLSGVFSVQVRNKATKRLVTLDTEYDMATNQVKLCGSYDLTDDFLVTAIGVPV